MKNLSYFKWKNVYEQLRSYQKDAVDFMNINLRALEFDDMGLGKTVVTLTSSLYHMLDRTTGNVLILCTANALFVWKEELEKWFGITPIMYIGTQAQRKKIFTTQMWGKTKLIVVSTYGMMKELKEHHWYIVIGDEIHQAGLLKHTNITFSLFKETVRTTNIIYLLTGTPVRQGVIDLFGPLNIILPNKFSSYWGFVNKYCITVETPFGKQIERRPKNVEEFRSMLSLYMIRRLKTEVLKDLPGKQRNTIPIQMTKKQTKAHQEIMEELYYSDEDNLIVTPNKMSAILRARQLLVTPRLLGIDEDGAALDYLKEVGEALLTANRPFVIYTPFRQAIPIIAEVITEIESKVSIHIIQGGMTPAAFANSWQSFQASKVKKKVMIATIKSGSSFHATEAADCFFLGYEWDFNQNIQAEDRLCRLGQNNFVNCNYLLHNDTVDEDVKNKLNDKQDAANWIVGTEEQYQMMLKRFKGGNKK